MAASGKKCKNLDKLLDFWHLSETARRELSEKICSDADSVSIKKSIEIPPSRSGGMNFESKFNVGGLRGAKRTKFLIITKIKGCEQNMNPKFEK